MPMAEKELDFSACVEKQLTCNTPALLCSVPGFDASGRVDDLAAELNKRITSIAIGSAEGFSQAERAINAACKSGHFCMLKVITKCANDEFISNSKSINVIFIIIISTRYFSKERASCSELASVLREETPFTSTTSFLPFILDNGIKPTCAR